MNSKNKIIIIILSCCIAVATIVFVGLSFTGLFGTKSTPYDLSPKNADEVYHPNNFNEPNNETAMNTYVSKCMDVVVDENKESHAAISSKAPENNQSSDSKDESVDSKLYYKIEAGQDGLNTLFISNFQDAGYTEFNTAFSAPWYSLRYTINRVDVKNEVKPINTIAWFGCTVVEPQGDVKLSNIIEFKGMQNIHLAASTNASFMFTGCNFAGRDGTIDGLPNGLSNVRNATFMFWSTKFPDDLLQHAILGLNNANNYRYCFANNANLTKATVDATKFTEDNANNFSYMFMGDTNLKIVFGLPQKINNSTNVAGMFRLCSGLEAIYVNKGTDWSNATSSKDMFALCNSLKGGCGSTISSGITAKLAKVDGGNDTEGEEGLFRVTNVTNSATTDGGHGAITVITPELTDPIQFVTDQGTFRIDSINGNLVKFYKLGDAKSEAQLSLTHTISASPEDEYYATWWYSYDGENWNNIEANQVYSVKQSGVIIKSSFPAASLTVPSWKQNLVYDATEHDVGDEDAAIYWNDYKDSKISISGETKATNAGANYKAIFSLKDKTIYKWKDGTKEDKVVEWAIDKADWTITKEPQGIFTKRDDNLISLLTDPGAATGPGIDEKGTFLYAKGSKNGPDTEFSEDIPTASQVGVYWIWYMVNEDNNHKQFVSENPVYAAITLTDSAVIIKEPEPKNQIYPAFEDLATKGLVIHGTMKYGLSNDPNTQPTTWTEQVPNASNLIPGTYYVWYKAEGKAPYGDAEGGKVEVKIENGQASFDKLPTSVQDLKYNGTKQVLITPATSSNGTPMYALSDSPVKPDQDKFSPVYTNIKAKESGTYFVHYYVKGNQYYTDTEDSYFTVDIIKSDITINIKGNSASNQYNGQEQNVNGWTANCSESFYNQKFIGFGGEAYAKGTSAGYYNMNLSSDQFWYTDSNVNAQFEIEDGYLKIGKANLTITVTGKNATFEYNTWEQYVEGYTFAVSPEYTFYDESKLVFNGEAKVKGTIPGIYNMGLTADQFMYDDPNVLSSIQIVDGYLTINKVSVDVKVYGHTLLVNYSGKEQLIEGYDLSCENSIIYQVGTSFTGKAEAKGTNAGTYNMNLQPSQFAINDQYIDAMYKIEKDGQLVINKISIDIDISCNKQTKEYNTQAQKVTIGYTGKCADPSQEFEVDSSKIVYRGDNSITATYVGDYSADFDINNFAYDDPDNVEVKSWKQKNPMQLEITKAKISVALTGHSDTFTYNTQEQSIIGFDADCTSTGWKTFFKPEYVSYKDGNENIKAKGINVGTYTEYYKGIDFSYADTNVDPDFSENVIVTLQITAKEIAVDVVGHHNLDPIYYDGNEHSVSGFDATCTDSNYDMKNVICASGKDTVKASAVGHYQMNLNPSDFTNEDANYNVTTFNVTDGYLEINKANYQLSKEPVPAYVEYDSDEHYMVSEAGKAIPGASFMYACTDNPEIDPVSIIWSSDYPKQKNIGTYYIWYKIPGNKNYNELMCECPLQAEIYSSKININGKVESCSYDGNSHTVSGYDVAYDKAKYPNFDINKLHYEDADPSITATDVKINPDTLEPVSYKYGLDATKFTYEDSLNPVSINVITDISLTIYPLDVDVDIIGKNAEVTYDGQSHSVEGVTYRSDCLLFDKDKVRFTGEATAKGTNADIYYMGLSESQFSYSSNNNNLKVRFNLSDGYIKINKAELTIEVWGNTKSVPYNAEPQKVSGFNLNCASGATSLYDESKVNYSGLRIVQGVVVGEYSTDIALEQFSYDDINIEATFIYRDGYSKVIKLTIY